MVEILELIVRSTFRPLNVHPLLKRPRPSHSLARWIDILSRTYIVEITTFSSINNVAARRSVATLCCVAPWRGEMRGKEERGEEGEGGRRERGEGEKSSWLKFLEINDGRKRGGYYARKDSRVLNDLEMVHHLRQRGE